MSEFPALLFKLNAPSKHYSWGSKSALTHLFNIPNPQELPLAEVWMGAHPAGCANLELPEGNVRLDEFIHQNPLAALGTRWSVQAALPFLFKMLSAQTALSIQVHPRLDRAQAGFAAENAQNIPQDAPTRNYRDPNHKPELIYAVTPFQALCGFRPFSEIATFLKALDLPVLNPALANFMASPGSETLKALFTAILSLQGQNQTNALATLLAYASTQTAAPFSIIERLAQQYPGDNGLFMPLLLNTIELRPGQALFLAAETPHAYLEGTGLEIMANSDNVLRGGLSPKHIDIAELTRNVIFEESTSSTYRVTPVSKGVMQIYPVPVDDFAFATFVISENRTIFTTHAPEIVLCMAGTLTLKTEHSEVQLQKGQACFVPAATQAYVLQGLGTGARVTAAA